MKRLFRKETSVGKKRSALRQWLDAGVFAIIVATLFRMFIAEAYAIPSGSMEGTMLINDHLYVSKMAYGARLPMTPLALPLINNTIPFIGSKSYTEVVKWNYRRLPGFGHVQRYDVVVFNGPDGDTAIADNGELDYYQLCRMYGRDMVCNSYKVVTRPVDKEDNLIKRCVGLPGDVLEIKNAQVYINGKPEKNYPHTKLNYVVRTNGAAPFIDDDLELLKAVNDTLYVYNLENSQLNEVRNAHNVTTMNLFMMQPAGVAPSEPGEWVFPFDTADYKWNRDNYGPIAIPKAGITIPLTPQNIALYRRVIRNYEGNTLEERDGKYYVNGKQATTYTFKMDYYWMMGDNRDNSLDSRYWGFVPEDHIVGKAWFVWFGYGKDGPVTDIHWSRLFRGIHALED